MNQTTQPEAASTDLIVMPPGGDLEVMFRTKGGISQIIARIEERVSSEAIDLTTSAGRKACRSLAYKVAQSKNALDAAGKDLNADMAAAIALVNAERKDAWTRLEALQVKVKAPLDAWEAAEEKRVIGHRNALKALDALNIGAASTAAEVEAEIAAIGGIVIDATWQEFEPVAIERRGAGLEKCRTYLEVAKVREAQAAEIAKLRAEAAEREAAAAEAQRVEADRLAALEAERAAERAAEAKAAADKLAAIETEQAAQKAAADRLLAEQAAMIQKLRDEAEKKAAAEAAAVAEAARIEAERLAAEQHAAAINAAAEAAAAQAVKDAEERHAKELADAEERAQKAAQDERDRAAAEVKAVADAKAVREADAAHRAEIRDDIVAALKGMAGKATPAAIADALIDGKIPHVTVNM